MVSVFFVKILQTLEGRLTRLRRQILNVFDFIVTDNGGLDVDDRATKITGQIVIIPARDGHFSAQISANVDPADRDTAMIRLYMRSVFYLARIAGVLIFFLVVIYSWVCHSVSLC